MDPLPRKHQAHQSDDREAILGLIERNRRWLERELADCADPSLITFQLMRLTSRGQLNEYHVAHPHRYTAVLLSSIDPSGLRAEIAAFIRLRAPAGTVKVFVCIDDPEAREDEAYLVRFIFFPMLSVDFSRAASA